MPIKEHAFREHLVRLLEWEDAHVGFDKAVAEIAPDKRGVRPAGFAHSAWELVEHMRIAQEDILDFCVNAHYTHALKWPDDYWPREAAAPNADAWNDSVTSFVQARQDLARLAREVDDLTATVPTGKGRQTYLRAILIAADHAAYHVGQLVAVRNALGIWGSGR